MQSQPFRRLRLANDAHPNLAFWILFLILNTLLFLPSYLFNQQSTSFFPINSSPDDYQLLARQLLIWRNNLDIFRLSAELTLLLTLWVFLPWQRWPKGRRIFRWFFGFILIFALAYAIYEALVFYLYQQEAVLFAHLSLLANGFEFVLDHFPIQIWQIVLAVFLFAGALFLLITLIRAITRITSDQRLHWISKGVLILLATASLLAVGRLGDTLTSPKSVVDSLLLKMNKNGAASLALYRQVHALDDFPYRHYYDYSGHNLLEKPDIYLIFIESYGSTLSQNPIFVAEYTSLLSAVESQLNGSGWHAASTLSESPSWGGGSWMAYTSALFGMRIDNHPQYEALLERFQEEEYPDLGHTMQNQGYAYVRATSLASELPDEKWQKYINFFGVDRWIRYRDLNYQGKHYGWGPSPPDQYVINALHEELDGERPFLLFWITQNSHYPWQKLPELVDDWQSLNDGSSVVTIFDEEDVSLETKKQNYFDAISYELNFMADFIIKEADDNAIIILIGDHQPGWITRRSGGFNTPVHIISKNKNFLNQFDEFGFEQGMEVSQAENPIRHEGFYSLFMRALLSQYGSGTSQLPPYLPNGIETEN